ncbi:MAG: membrane integrity-associated transporter subunit PqiC, partial [Alphaproteobacteria bacterium]|nr:membrane integrity-associated transporter subunit PqiC [Alphaproteobacteria bacterium]
MKKLLWGLFLMLCACSFRSPNSQFYMMSSQGLPTLSDKNMSIAVAKVKVPDMLDKSQMVIYDGNSGDEVAEVKILEFQRWAEVYPEMLQNTVTNDLIAYLPNAYVERTYFDSNKALYSINIEVNQ